MTNSISFEKKKKSGIMLGFITDGMVPARWMMRFNQIILNLPPGMVWKVGFHEGRGFAEKGAGWAEARNKVVDIALNFNVKWLFFIDTDVFPPLDVIRKLMHTNKEIVSGIYFTKTKPSHPIIMKDEGCGPYYDFPIDEKFEIDGSGMGCCLIDMDVFDKFKKENIPYFKENWIDIKPDGENVRMNISEDLWFFKKAKELGYRVWCDSSVLCDHMGIETGEIFPTKEEFKKIQRRIEEKKEKVEK